MNDRRAVAGLVGAVLLFGILVISLSLYQAQVVPSENQRAEFEHSQHVQNQMEDVRNAILRTASSGNSQPTSVTLGTRYPGRTVAVNPPPATGQLATEDLGNVTISGVYAASGPEGFREYLKSERYNLTYNTSALVYTPDYNEYRNAPRTIYENGLLYNYFDNGANLTLTGQSIISGNRLTLVTFTGDYDESGVRSTTVDPHPSSAPYQEVTVTNESGPIVLSLPTGLSADKWRGMLSQQMGSKGRVQNVSTGANGTVEITLEPGTYVLQLSRVGVGQNVPEPNPHYIISRSGDGATLNPGESHTLGVAVRDRFNNPFAGQLVNATITEGGNGTLSGSVTTGANGDASFTYTAPGVVSGSESVSVTVWFGASSASGASTLEKTTFDLTVSDSGSGDASDNGPDSGATPSMSVENAGPFWGEGVQFDLVNDGTTDATIASVRVTRAPSAAQIRETDTYSGGAGFHEIHVEGPDQSGYYDANDETGAAYDIGSMADVYPDVPVPAGERATITLYEFENRNGNDRSMSGKTIEVEVTFANGATETYLVSV